MAGLTKQEALNELWRRGSLSFKLDTTQKELYRLYKDGKDKINVWLLARRSGKSYTLLTIALETCLRNNKAIVNYLAPTKLQVNGVIRPLLRTLLEDCPEELKPRYNTKDYCFYFSNGAELRLAGADSGHAEKLRGGDSNLAIIDEAGSVDNLDYIVKSILLPTTLMTKGKILLASTPAISIDHEFNRFIEEADLRGNLIKKTVYDNPRLSSEDLEELIKEVGGKNSPGFLRELMCEIVRDASISVLPEYTLELEKEIVKEWPKPPFLDTYVSMDLGFKDLTAVLFGYYDFRGAKLIIEDEIVLKGEEIKLPDLSASILKKEEDLWTDFYTNEKRKPYLRISDINYLVTGELTRISCGQLSFVNPNKDDKDAAINMLRVMLANKKIIINPKCDNLLRHLRNVKWKSFNNKKEFGTSPDNGHYDCVDALIYLVRMVNYSRNPYPANYQMDLANMYFKNPGQHTNNSTDQHEVYKKIFRIKGRKYDGR